MQGAHHEGPANLRGVQYVHCVMHKCIMGSSIKYVTLFLANFDPSSPFTLCHTSREPSQKVRHTFRIHPNFSKPITKIPDKSLLYKFYLNCSRVFCPGGFRQG